MKFLIILFSCFFHFNFVSASQNKINFWNTQKRGANFFNSVERIERFQAAKELGVQVIRLAPNKWLNKRAKSGMGNFLLGSSKNFTTINQNDLNYLISILNDANKVGLKVVLTMLSLPGARWKQHNHGIEERKIWEDFAYQEKTILFWKQLATALKEHPAVVGYNIRNEPSPELVEPKLKDWYSGDYSKWYSKVRGTPSDLNLFYRKIVKAIRTVDNDTPIVLDSGYYASPWGFKVLEPVDDKKTLYSFHMYEPYSYNSKFNNGKYKYPGKAPIGELGKTHLIMWNKSQIENFLNPITEWQNKYKIPSERIFVGEVGVFRTNDGAEAYLKDVLNTLNKKKWHWAFYSFREDTWPGMNYELGTKKAGWKYWQAIEKNQMPRFDSYKKNPLIKIITSALRGEIVP